MKPDFKNRWITGSRIRGNSKDNTEEKGTSNIFEDMKEVIEAIKKYLYYLFVIVTDILIYGGFLYGLYYIVVEVDYRRVSGVEWLLSGILIMLILLYFKIKK